MKNLLPVDYETAQNFYSPLAPPTAWLCYD